MKWGAGFVLVLLGACAPAMSAHTDDVPDRVRLGCNSYARCEALQAEAEARAERCLETDIDPGSCQDAASDLRIANAYLGEWKRKAAEEHADEEQEARRQAQEDALVARLREEDELKRANAECQRQRADAHAAVDQATQQARDFQLAYLRLLGPASRARKLEDCYAEHTDCWDVVRLLLDSSASDSEKKSIAELNERLLHGPHAPTHAPADRASTR